MDTDGSVTRWLDELKAGEPAAGQQLWERFFHRLVALARRKLADAPRRVSDEEDVALSAFDSFLKGVERGRFPRLDDREDLWRLLVVLTARKAAHLRRDQARLKRGGHLTCSDADEQIFLEELLGKEPDPAFAAEMAEQCHFLLDQLRDPALRTVALRRMEGDSVEEIALLLGVAPRSIKRKLQLIRELWETEPTP